MPAALQSTSHGATMVLTLTNPEQHNALGPDIYAAGVETLSVAESSPEVRSVVITGAGSIFSAGSLAQRASGDRREELARQIESIDGLHSWIDAIRTFPKPVIAAVEGSASGAGFSLALACDLIVAARNAEFAMDHSNAALSPDGGATWHLTRAMPRQLAAELLLLGECIGAERLHALGVVNLVAAAGAALSDALALAERLNARAPNAMCSIKDLLNEAGAATLPAQLARERDQLVANLHHANANAAIAALLDKTTPRYL